MCGSRAIAMSRRAWPSPIGEQMSSSRLGRDWPWLHGQPAGTELRKLRVVAAACSRDFS
jgi:hypothetical protein